MKPMRRFQRRKNAKTEHASIKEKNIKQKTAGTEVSMNEFHESHMKRWDQVCKNIRNVRDYDTMIYIGALAKSKYPSGMHLMPYFKEANYTTDVMEIWGPNVKSLIELNEKMAIFRTIFKGDVRLTDSILKNACYDIVVWWHGPEHLEIDEIPPTLTKLERIAKHLVILGMPYEREPRKGHNDNPYEKHKCALFPDFFEKLGYSTDHYGRMGHFPNNLLAWKRTNDVV